MADTLRISQVLPSVKCSQCNRPVPLTELSEHQCAPAPPVPKLAVDIPKLAANPTHLLPARFQSPTAAKPPSPVDSRPRTSSNNFTRSSQINPNAIPPNSPRALRRPSPSPSPLSRKDINASTANNAPSFSQPIHTRNTSIASVNTQRRPSVSSVSGSSVINSPTTSRARQGSYASSSPLIPQRLQTPQPRQQPSPQAQQPSVRMGPMSPPELDTKTGGEAGMAGVGRRGFAAAARAAMFVSPVAGPSNGPLHGLPLSDNGSGWQPQIPNGAVASSSALDQNSMGMDGRRANAPRFLDINTGGNIVATRSRLNSHTPTPPLTPNSGGSLHSQSPSSLSPQSPFGNSATAHGSSSRTPSPSMYPAEPASSQGITAANSHSEESPTETGLSSSLRMPFFDKIRAKLPGALPTPVTSMFPSSITNDDTANDNTTDSTPTTATAFSPSDSVTPVPRNSTFSRDRTSSVSSASSASSYASSVALDNETETNRTSHISAASTATSVGLKGLGSRISSQTHTRSISSDSNSEYGGLAYADSGNESEASSVRSSSSRRKLPPVPVPSHNMPSILRAASDTTSNGQVRFPSMNDDHGRPAVLKSSRSTSSMSSQSSTENFVTRTGRLSNASTSSAGSSAPRPLPTRTATADIPRRTSVTRSNSQSSLDDESSLARSNSARFAHALGLSSTPPSAYGRMGGPGIGTRSRQGSNASSRSKSGSVTSRSERSGSNFILTALEDKEKATAPEGSISFADNPASTRPTNVSFAATPRTIGQRSNTIPGLQSPGKSSSTLGDDYLPRNSATVARSRTNPTVTQDLVRDSNGDTKPAVAGSNKQTRKIRQCVKCEKRIQDGRWVQVDGGGVLCEHCWKNMYLPKCRRCNLVIEKQAVSSSDGQLKGKYHKDCFNCHTCHKPFPDKTFYVHDGKPYCAFHYHEANESLCAAALCGQPIEGECAVSHTGDRYHPEHLLCEYPGSPKCTKTLLGEYWEVDGRMLCERHQRRALAEDNENPDRDWVPTAKALKRTTRFIDLAGGGDSLR